MAARVIRLNELASFPEQPEKPKRKGEGTTPAKPAKQGKLPVSPATIWRWVREGRFPAPFKLGNNVTVWDEDVIDQFLAAQAMEGQ